MRTISQDELKQVSGGAGSSERYPGGARGWRDGEHGARVGTAILDLILQYQNR